MERNLTRDFFLGFIKIHILHHAGKGRIFGSDFRAELARHGYDVSFGTLYPIFHRLERQGYLASKRERVAGRRRTYYTLTDQGRTTLEEAKRKARELFTEIEEEPATSRDGD